MRILFDLDLDILEKIWDIIAEFRDDVALLSLQEAVFLAVEKKNIGIKTFSYPCLSDSPDQGQCPAWVVWSVLNDHQTWLILDRMPFSGLYFDSANNKANRISSMVRKAYSLIKNEGVTDYLNQTSPHSPEEWIFAKTAEAVGVRVWYMQETALPWVFGLYQGLSREPKFVQLKVPNNNTNDRLLDEFVAKKRGAGSHAIPFYEKDRLRKNKGKYFLLLNEVKSYWRRPDLIINKFFRYRQYVLNSKGVAMEKPYVVYFMHFQPERTSLPESYGFSVQLVAISELRAALPSGVMLVVKEHPATFTTVCNRKWRDKYFYESVRQMQGVKIAPLEQDTYELMDNAMAVSTLTGTVAAEALLRNRPTVMLGAGHSIGFKHAYFHRYEDHGALQVFFAKIFSCEEVINVGDEYFNYLKNICAFASSGLSGDEGVPETGREYLRCRSHAMSKLVRRFMGFMRNPMVS